jgi:Flp pilus assembly protein TadB
MEGPLLILIPLVAIPVVMAVPILIVYLATRYSRQKREMLSRERLAAIEKGMDVPLIDPPTSRGRILSPLYGALITLGVGMGLTLFMWTIAGGYHGPWGVGIMITLVGIAMLAHWILEGREQWRRDRDLDEELKRAYIERLRSGKKD